VDSSVAERLARARERIDAAARTAGRTDSVELVAISKSFPIERVVEAWLAGHRVFGENRVQEGAEKAAQLPEATWHLVGHLQTNKARPASRTFALIESVDSVRLARKLDAEAAPLGIRLPVLLEVNVAAEASKNGFSADEIVAVMPEVAALPGLHVRGLMTVAPIADEAENVRWVFRALRELRDQLAERYGLADFDQLSMGMTDDFEVAIQEGATMVRIGRAIFGERPPGGAG
jgi:pyridoxal phosphate enzyme (YggS family)